MKKIILITTVVFILIVAPKLTNAQSSNWIWATTANGLCGADGGASSTDLSGNVFGTGLFAGGQSIVFGSDTLIYSGGGGSDIFLVKYDANGNELWAKQAGEINTLDVGQAVSNDNNGNVFLTGYFQSSNLIFDNDTLTISSAQDFFLAKFDANGNVLWTKSAGGISAGYGVSTDKNGNVFVAGFFSGSNITFGTTTLLNNGNENIFLAKYDSNGNVLWAKSAGGTGVDDAYSLSTDKNGNVFVAGVFESDTITFGTTTLLNHSLYREDIFIAKYDSSGNALWAKSAGSTDDDYAYSVSADSNGNAFLVGGFRGTVVFGSTTLSQSGTGDDSFIVKYNSNGNVLWAKSSIGSFSDDKAVCVRADNKGNAYMSGSFGSPTITFGSVTLSPPLANCVGGCDPMFIVKYDSSGNVLCASALASGGEDAMGLSVDTIGNAYIDADYWGNPFIIGTDTLNNYGTYFIAKYKASCISEVGIDDIKKSLDIEIFPNPFSTQTTLRTDNFLKNATLTVYNCFGQTIAQIKNLSGQTVTFFRDNLASGLYFIRLTEENKIIAVDKLVITDK